LALTSQPNEANLSSGWPTIPPPRVSFATGPKVYGTAQNCKAGFCCLERISGACAKCATRRQDFSIFTEAFEQPHRAEPRSGLSPREQRRDYCIAVPLGMRTGA
jgi:hypothetical protein